MFGVSVKAWRLDNGEEEVSFIITHIASIKRFLLLYLDLMASDFLVDKQTVDTVRTHVPESLLVESSLYRETWSSSVTFQKTQDKVIENENNNLDGSEIPHDFLEPLDSIKEEDNPDNVFSFSSLTDFDTVPEQLNFHENSSNIIDVIMKSQVFDDEFVLPDVMPKCRVKTRNESEVRRKCGVSSCNVRDLTFKSSKELKNHQKEEHSNLYCNKCNIVLPSEAEFLTHNCNKRYKCNQCERLFSTNHELKSHSMIHSGEKPHMCDFCGKGFRQRATLDRHKLTHESRRKYECNICNKKFKFKHYLVSHKLLHSGVKPHMCTWCGMRFAQNANMQKHIRLRHTNDRSHVCKYCGKGFVQPYYLRRHMASHKETETEKASLDMMVESHTSSDEQTGIRTFACKFCSVTCKGQIQLKSHIKKHHQQEEKDDAKLELVSCLIDDRPLDSLT